jgi:hypothetical protein
MEKLHTVSLTTTQYDLLLEMFNIISDLDFYDDVESPEEWEQFDSLWDAVIAASKK